MKNILLLIIAFFTINLNAQTVDCTELFISEYIEGPGNNNAIEIYNPSNTTIDLSDYTINRYSNGAATGPESWQLSGTIGPEEAIVVGNGQLDSVWVATYWSLPVDPNFYSMLDDHCNGDYDANSTFYFNGDDAMTLEYNGTSVDIFGKVGEDPGQAWTDDASAGYTDANGGTWWTKRQTLIRKSSIIQGVTQNPIIFNPTLEYDSLPDATYSNLGAHICDCPSATNINETNDPSYLLYPNPAIRGDIVSINTNTYVKSIILTNALGKRVRFNRLINTSDLAKGTYIIDIEFSDGKFAKNKLIVN